MQLALSGSPYDQADSMKLTQFLADWGALWSSNSKCRAKIPNIILEIKAIDSLSINQLYSKK